MKSLPDEFDPGDIDLSALMEELNKIGKELRESAGDDDIEHIKKIERWGKTCTALGYGTAWMAPNPLSWALISQGVLTRWLLMHHVSHRGYDRIPGIPEKYNSKVFAHGWRRVMDWMDWILPEAWHEEHDFLHHYNLGEDDDPDVLERNAAWMKEEDFAPWKRKVLAAFLAVTWKWIYYAPKTMEALQEAQARRNKDPKLAPAQMLSPFNDRGREVWKKALLPHFAWRFGAIPAFFAPLGPVAMFNVLINSIGAEIFTNIHAFLVITPSHTADDLYRFDDPVSCREEFFLRQILGSANYTTGGDLNDWAHMWLNYQIEHHIWPDMTMLQYRKAQPKIEALCKEMDIPYVQDTVFKRAKKMLDVLVGDASMKRIKGLARKVRSKLPAAAE